MSERRDQAGHGVSRGRVAGGIIEGNDPGHRRRSESGQWDSGQYNNETPIFVMRTIHNYYNQIRFDQSCICFACWTIWQLWGCYNRSYGHLALRWAWAWASALMMRWTWVWMWIWIAEDGLYVPLARPGFLPCMRDRPDAWL